MVNLKEKLTAILKKHGVKLQVNADVKLEEIVETADGQQVGSPTEIAEGQELWTMVDGVPVEPIQEGTYELADGRVVVVANGLIESVTPAATDDTELEAIVADLAAQVAAGRSQLENLQRQIADRDARLSALQTQAATAKAEAQTAKTQLQALMGKRRVNLGKQEPMQVEARDLRKLNETEAVVHLYNQYRKN